MESIFKEVVHIMQHDYAGWKDKIEWDQPDYFSRKIKKLKEQNLLTKELFTEIVNDYLVDFNDKHIFFKCIDSQSKKMKNRGFHVRRYEDRLYVSDVEQETRLKKGMFFKSLGGISIPELKEIHKRLLNENHPERENWTPILSFYDDGEIEDEQGRCFIFSFKKYEKEPYTPVYSVSEIENNTLLFRITDFMNPDAIISLMEKNKESLDSYERWIIDVRVNYGGSDISFYQLLPYIMPEEGVELMDKDDKMLFHCTNSNCNRQIEDIEKDLDTTQDEQARFFLNFLKKEWELNKGKGFVEFNIKDFLPNTFIKGKKNPKEIVVLSDCKCGSSGESFIEICKKSRKVKVIGRATMGLNDYANLTRKKWDEGFELWYPTSRLSRIDMGQGMTGKGIEPHMHIPWTPEHLETDRDLEAALNLFSS